MKLTVYHGTLVHSIDLHTLKIIPNGTLVVQDSTIVRMEEDVALEEILNDLSPETPTVHRLGPHQMMLPGFIDTHAHAPQYAFAGSGMNTELLPWLEEYVFPTESRFAKLEYAEKIYQAVVKRFLKNGTTTCSWFATIHLDACKLLVDIIDRLGQRAMVGKVNMDQNSPAYYIETSADKSIEDTRAFIKYAKLKPLVTPVITPRFAITCTTDLLKGLGDLAEEYDLPIQTHLCENPNEIKFSRELFKDSATYTHIYKDHKLLTPKSYMAHCVHMTDEEIKLLAAEKTGVAHCANSNFSLQSGLCNVRRLLAQGVKVGLGTDVAGGFSSSILDAIRSSFFASNTIQTLHRDGLLEPNDGYRPLQPAELFYLATLGGAEVLGLAEVTGNFLVGKAFDALWVDLDSGPVDLNEDDTLERMVEKFLFNGNDQNLLHVFVNGRRVAGEANVAK